MALSRGFTQNSGTTPVDTRLMDAAKFTRNADGTVRTGVLWVSTSTGNVIGSLASMAVIAKSADFILSRGVSDGAVLLSNVGDVTIPIPTAPTANSRYDVVWVKQNDGGNGGQGDADSLPTWGVASGAAVANPQLANTLALVPTGALPLASVLIPANVTTTNAAGVVITNLFNFTAMAGDPVRYRTEADMRADTSIGDGASAYVVGGGLFYRRVGYWTRVDAATFAVLQAFNDVSMASGTTLNTLGAGASSDYVSSDPVLVPNGSGTFGPLPLAGYYEVSWTVNWTSNSTGERYVEVTSNDVSFNPPAADRRPASGTSNMTGTVVLYFAAGQYIKLKGWQNSGSTLSYRSRVVAKLLRGA